MPAARNEVTTIDSWLDWEQHVHKENMGLLHSVGLPDFKSVRSLLDTQIKEKAQAQLAVTTYGLVHKLPYETSYKDSYVAAEVEVKEDRLQHLALNGPLELQGITLVRVNLAQLIRYEVVNGYTRYLFPAFAVYDNPAAEMTFNTARETYAQLREDAWAELIHKEDITKFGWGSKIRFTRFFSKAGKWFRRAMTLTSLLLGFFLIFVLKEVMGFGLLLIGLLAYTLLRTSPKPQGIKHDFEGYVPLDVQKKIDSVLQKAIDEVPGQSAGGLHKHGIRVAFVHKAHTWKTWRTNENYTPIRVGSNSTVQKTAAILIIEGGPLHGQYLIDTFYPTACNPEKEEP